MRIVCSILTIIVVISGGLWYSAEYLEQPNQAVLRLDHLGDEVAAPTPFSGGGTTIRDTGRNSYGRSPANMASFKARWPLFREGKGVFERDWGKARNGQAPLGPMFNARACDQCHRRDGRSQPPLYQGEIPEGLTFRLSTVDGEQAQAADPLYGEQLDYYGVEGTPGEGSVAISHGTMEGSFADGSGYALQRPDYSFTDLAHGPMSGATLISPRVAPANFGLGLLEMIPEQDIYALADPDDANGDGISGRPNYVYDHRLNRPALGRFGWKANQPTLEQQILKALNADIGVTSAMFPDDGATVRPASSGATELRDDDLTSLLFYMKLLAVPKQRDWQAPAVQRGRMIFRSIGCAGCHATHFITGDDPAYPELSRQTIHPYTDLLLHDMGEDLADNRPDGRATGREWRTPPLWGIGLLEAVSGHTRLLHDGRARNIEEAILWHGGEASASQNLYRRLPRTERNALLAFLGSL